MEVRALSLQNLKDQISIPFPQDDGSFQPEIIWQSNGNPVKIKVSATMIPWAPRNSSEQAIFRSARDGYVQKIPSDWYNGVLNTFRGVTNSSEGEIHISLGTVRYFDYLTSTLEEFKGGNVIERPNPIVLSGMLITKDGKILLGNRSARTAIPRPGQEQLSQIGVIGGTYNRIVQSGNNGNEIILNRPPQDDMLNEITDELGITPNDVDLRLHAIVGDKVLSRTILMFHGAINMTAQEVLEVFHERGNKNEHFGLVFVDINEDAIQSLMGENITVATAMVLATFLGK